MATKTLQDAQLNTSIDCVRYKGNILIDGVRGIALDIRACVPTPAMTSERRGLSLSLPPLMMCLLSA
jgi:hypothetical protein